MLSPKYLSFSIYQDFGWAKDVLKYSTFTFSLEKLQQHNIRPKSWLKICEETIEKLYWEYTFFWNEIKLLPPEIKDNFSSLACDTDEKLKARYENNEINHALHNKFYRI